MNLKKKGRGRGGGVVKSERNKEKKEERGEEAVF